MNNASGNIQSNMQVLNIPIEDIIPNRFQPRLNFDESGLKELAASIKEHGIIQPLVLRRIGDKYEIIAGERRYKAAKMAGLMSVPAIISEMDDKKSAEVAIVENVQRRNLSSIEEAKSYKTLLDKGYTTQDELAKKMGLSQSAISNKLRLLSLATSVQEALMDGKISERHARSLLVLDDLKDQEQWLQIILNERLSVKELDKRLQNFKKKITDDDIPIIETMPNINAIKENAIDIKEKVEDITPKTPVNENVNPSSNQKIPNTYFNFLENEAVNMNSIDTPAPITNNIDNSEEVELLDFLAPLEQQKSEVLNTSGKDMSKANTLIDELVNNLKENNYGVNIIKIEDDNIVKYEISINKD